MPADHVSFAGPGKTPAELSQAIAAGVTIEMESETEAERIAMIGERLGIRPRVAVRVNPDFQVKGSGMRMGGGPQQFGVDAEQVPALLPSCPAPTSSSSASTSSRARRTSTPRSSARRSARPSSWRCGSRTQRRRPSATSTSAAASASRTSSATSRSTSTRSAPTSSACWPSDPPHLPEARVVIELGRYIVGESGFYVTRVVDRKESRGKTFLVVDGGMHHQLAASGNFGQVIRRNYPVAIANRTATTRPRR